ncbi:MAG: sel1 repeat family protein [Rhodocyclales bacterium]|nr:sel1 repeat family protein [Rhodocyclales bacterium]
MLRCLAIVLALFLAVLPANAATPVEQKKAAKSKAAAKAKSAARLKAATKAKAGSKAVPKSVMAPAMPVTLARLGRLHTENELQKAVAAARTALAKDPANLEAKEVLARAAILTSDWLLAAEAIGSTAKAERLGASLKRDFSDTGGRVRILAQQGDPKARQALGVFYGRGVVLAPDIEKSCAEFKTGADRLPGAGWHWAQCLLDASPEEAWAQMERAALGGHAAAQEWIGRRCLGEFGATGKDFACAREWLSQSASQGRPRAQTLLAYLVVSGQGGVVDASRGLRLYQLAAENGDPDAQNNLGEIYESGRGVEKNPAVALQWYERGAESGLGSAQFNAGRMWAIGVSGKSDPAKARAWLAQAEKKGITQARQVLDWLDQQTVTVPVPASKTGMAELNESKPR